MDVNGRLTALSHVLRSPQKYFALELVNDKDVRHVIFVRDVKLFNWLNILVIGESYSVNELIKARIKFKFQKKAVRILRAQKNSECQHRNDISFSLSQSYGPQSPQASVSGFITHIDLLIGIVTLNKTAEVFISYQLGRSAIPTLCKGLNVTFFNIHKISENLKTSVYVMCTRGFVLCRTQFQDSKKFISRDNECPLGPLVLIALKHKIGILDLIWLHKEAKVICSLFPEHFLLEFFESRELAANIRLRIISHVAEESLLPQEESVAPSSFLEFVKVKNHVCLPMKESRLRNKSAVMFPQTFHLFEKPSDVSLHTVEDGFLKRQLQGHFYSVPIVGILSPAADGVLFDLMDYHSELPVVVVHKKVLVPSSNLKELHHCMVIISEFLAVNHLYVRKCHPKVKSFTAFHIEVTIEKIETIKD